jgi:hypothetical protein
MTPRRVLLVVAVAAFVGWLGWLGVAVYQARWADPNPVVSRAQLTAATHILVADVDIAPDGYPTGEVRVTKVLRGAGIEAGDLVEVLNLKAALPPGEEHFPGPGVYLIPVVREADRGPFVVAGVPRSPGYDPVSARVTPAVYRWNADTEAQLRGLGVVP